MNSNGQGCFGRDGTCGSPVWADGYCWNHHPDNAYAVRENASVGGRGHGDPRLAELRTALQELYVEVKDNGYETTRANTLIRIVTAQIDIVKADREVALDQLQAEFEEFKREIGILS